MQNARWRGSLKASAIESACDAVSKACGIQLAGLFSLMLTRLEVTGSELDHVLGHLPGVEPEDFKGGTHGGLVETSQLLALHPELIDPDYKDSPRRDVARWLAEKGEERDEAPGAGITALSALLRHFRAALHDSFTGPTIATNQDEALELMAELVGTRG
ncbi:MAG: hypothetical protein QF570_04800 [Myxococcota bacterium]|nr:hypothetical protein [Myxococcota bacterium]